MYCSHPSALVKVRKSSGQRANLPGFATTYGFPRGFLCRAEARREETRRLGAWNLHSSRQGPFDGTSLAEELEALHMHGLRHYYKTVPDVDV